MVRESIEPLPPTCSSELQAGRIYLAAFCSSLFWYGETRKGTHKLSPVLHSPSIRSFLRCSKARCGHLPRGGGWPRLNPEKRLWVLHPCGFQGAGFGV